MTVVTAFDADVLIYAAAQDHPLGARVAALFTDEDIAGVGSLLLLPEVLTKPMRDDATSAETAALISLLSRLDLRSFDDATARLALVPSVSYGLRAADGAHLATAVAAGADRFLTKRTFPRRSPRSTSSTRASCRADAARAHGMTVVAPR